MSDSLAGLTPYLLLVLIGFLPNEIWRMLGLVFSHGLDETSEILQWVRATATAILAAVIAKLILFASGALAQIAIEVRVGAALIGVIAFLVLRRSVFAGVLAGEIALIAGGWFYPG